MTDCSGAADTIGRMLRRVAAALAAIVVAAAAVVAFLYFKGREATPLRPGDAIPDLELRTLAGAPARVRDNLGPAVVVVFLDTRWPVMERYAQVLERLNRRYRQRGFRVVAIGLDDSADVLRDFAMRNGVTYPLLHDPGGRVTGPAWGTVSGPVAYVVDANGRVVAGHPTPVDWQRDEHRERIEALLPPPPPGWY